MTYLYRTSLSTLSLASLLLLSACGGGGSSSSSGGTTTNVPAADTAAPTVRFTPATISVSSGETGSSDLTATDARGVTSGPTVTCTNGGSFNVTTDTFTAPAVTADITSICTATAGDAAGNSGTGTLTVNVAAPPPPDTSAPVITFTPAQLTVASGSTETAILTVTDPGGVSATPTASCTNGGSYNVTTGVFTPPVVTANTIVVCTVSVTDDAGNTGTGTITVTVTPAPAASTDNLSGTLTYDRVPVFNSREGLNYNNIIQLPIRQAPVELVSNTGAVLQTTTSDDEGNYSFAVDPGENVRVRVRSEVQMTGANEVDLKVVDNTSGDAVYALQGGLSVVPTTNQTRDLNADSGWGGTNYTTTRAAAPFALLDTIYTTLEGFIAVDPEVDFPAFNVQWSTRNRSESGNVADGQIGTSSFTVANGVPVIRILGDENNDTDEYDVHVVVHEFGHYFENSLSRADSIGGPHSSNDRLDARVAFGEGWGNALSGMILEDSFYRDTFGFRQGTSFFIDVENNSYPGSTGWYSEGSVQSILYDLYDTVDDGADTASLGLGPIYNAFVDPAYKDTAAFTSIFAFLNSLESQEGVIASQVTALTDAQDINGTGQFGVGETNNGGIPDMLPVYLLLSPNNSPVEFCSRDDFGEFNRHGNRRFFAFNIPTAGNYRFTITRISGQFSTDPDFLVFQNGDFIGVGQSPDNNSEVEVVTLAAGQHVMSAFDFNNLGIDTSASTGDSCFTMRLEAQ